MKHLLLIDSNSLIHRAYHAFPKDLQNSQGILTGATFGFAKSLLLAIKELKPDCVTAAFDLGAPTFRHQKYAEYKAHRVKMDDELVNQLPQTKEVLEALNIPVFELETYEADDLIGTLATQAKKQDLVTTIVTGDLDALQLVDEKNIFVWTPANGLRQPKIYDQKEVLARFGFEPELMTDYKALKGDPSDNIPGISGIGDKTAKDLIIRYGNLDSIYQKLEKNELENVSERIKAKLKAEKEIAYLSKDLATIDCNAPIKLNVKASQLDDFDLAKAEKVFTSFGFKSLLKDLPANNSNSRFLFGSTDNEELELSQLDQELEPVLRKMEQIGIKIDILYLSDLANHFNQEISKLKEEIFSISEEEFNLDSPLQISHILYEKLLLPSDGLKKGKSGYFSTDVRALWKLKDLSPIIPLILQYRELTKLLNTYILPLPKLVDEKNRLHSHYAPNTASGRISSKEPNLQNIPNRTDLGKKIRQAFIAESGHLLLSVDYSQIELRVVAHLSKDENMIKAFQQGQDIHQATSEKMSVDRRVAKIMNFSILYGKRAYTLADDLHIYPAQAQDFIDTYFQAFPKVKRYIDSLIQSVKSDGYVLTLFGKKRVFPDYNSANRFEQAGIEREAVNHPIQGTAAEILKKAMIKISQSNLPGSLILTVHDELVFEVKKEQITNLANQVKEIMEQVTQLLVPLVVELKSGTNWGEMSPLP